MLEIDSKVKVVKYSGNPLIKEEMNGKTGTIVSVMDLTGKKSLLFRQLTGLEEGVYYEIKFDVPFDMLEFCERVEKEFVDDGTGPLVESELFIDFEVEPIL